MTTDQLLYFYEVAKCLNFSQAAHNLYISQPNLTKYIANLEKELGFRLFDRSTHHCQLTEAGQQFLRSTETLFFQLNGYIESAKLRAQNPYRVVNIGVAQAEMPPRQFMRHLNTKNSGTQLRYLIQEDNYLGLTNKLLEHELDMIVTTDKNVRNVNSLSCLTLRPFHMLLAIHNDNPHAHKQDLKPIDCADDIFFICIPEGRSAPMTSIEEIYWKIGARMNIQLLYSPADVLFNVQIGAGVGLVPETLDLLQFHDISFYAYEQLQEATQMLVWRKDDTREEILSLIEDVRQMVPFQQPPEVPVFGLNA